MYEFTSTFAAVIAWTFRELHYWVKDSRFQRSIETIKRRLGKATPRERSPRIKHRTQRNCNPGTKKKKVFSSCSTHFFIIIFPCNKSNTLRCMHGMLLVFLFGIRGVLFPVDDRPSMVSEILRHACWENAFPLLKCLNQRGMLRVTDWRVLTHDVGGKEAAGELLQGRRPNRVVNIFVSRKTRKGNKLVREWIR